MIRHAFLSLLLCALCAATSFAQSVSLPEKVEVNPGRLAGITIRWDGDDLRWICSPEIDVFREYDPDPKVVRLRLIGYEEGSFKLVAITCKDGKLSEFASCAIVVGKPGPGPGPNPPPPPPPAPDDPLLKALQKAYGEDIGGAEKAVWKAALRGVYKSAGELDLAKIKTAGELYSVLRNSSKSVIADDNALFNLRTAIADLLKEQLPSAPSAELNQEHRQKAKLFFNRLAAVLEHLK